VHAKSLFYYVFPWDGLSIYLTCSLKREENLTCPICYVEAIYILYYKNELSIGISIDVPYLLCRSYIYFIL